MCVCVVHMWACWQIMSFLKYTYVAAFSRDEVVGAEWMCDFTRAIVFGEELLTEVYSSLIEISM